MKHYFVEVGFLRLRLKLIFRYFQLFNTSNECRSQAGGTQVGRTKRFNRSLSLSLALSLSLSFSLTPRHALYLSQTQTHRHAQAGACTTRCSSLNSSL